MQQFFSATFRKPLLPALFLLFAAAAPVTAQNLPLNFLFRPNAWAGYEHIGPAQLQKGTVSLPSPYVGLTVPLYTGVGLDRKPFKLRAHQIMGQLYGRYQLTQFANAGADSVHEHGFLRHNTSGSYVVTPGFIGVKAGLGEGIWVYGARATVAIGVNDMSEPAFNVVAAVARAQLKGLHKGYLYGLGIFVSQDMIIPIPAFGYYLKPYREVTFYVMFPVQTRLSYDVTEKFTVAYQSTLSARPAIVQVNTPEGIRNTRFNSLGLRHGLNASLETGKHSQFIFEGGFMLPQQLSLSDKTSVDYFAKPTWYFDISFMRSFGDNLFVSPLGTF